MGLFDKIKGAVKDAIQESIDEANKEKEEKLYYESYKTANFKITLNQNKTFRKHKRFKMTVIYDKENLDHFSEANPLYKISSSNTMGKTEEQLANKPIFKTLYDFEGCKITVESYYVNVDGNEYTGLQILADGIRIGRIFSDRIEHCKMIMDNPIESVYVLVEGGKYKLIENVGSGEYSFIRLDSSEYGYLYVKFKE